MDIVKKRRIEYEIYTKSIIKINQENKNWLVEWTDGSRTWEPYDKIKDLVVFKDFIEKTVSYSNKKYNIRPEYIS
jgi:hypothetical protein